MRPRFGLSSLLLIVTGIAFNPGARAADLVLFRWEADTEEAIPVDGYDRLVSNLVAGDRVIFADGSALRIGERLGSGNTTAVFALEQFPKAALRLPLRSGPLPERIGSGTFPVFIRYFWNGGKLLQHFGVPTVGLWAHLPGQYVIVERIDADSMSFEEVFLSERPSSVETTAFSAKKARDSFLRFAQATAPFSRIADFRADQIRYEPRKDRWILVDWSQNHAMGIYREGRDKMARLETAFDSANSIGKSFWKEQWFGIEDHEEKGLKLRLENPQFAPLAELAQQVWKKIQDERRRILLDPELSWQVIRPPSAFSLPEPETPFCSQALLPWGA